jgi:hypothetical protein
MAAHLHTLTKTTAAGTAAPAIAPACSRLGAEQDDSAAAGRMTYERNADLKYALVARCLR